MITTGMLVVFGGFLLLNSFLIALFVRVNISTQEFIGWLNTKQAEMAEVENSHTVNEQITNAIQMFSEWFHQTKMVIIPAVLCMQFITAVSFGDVLEQKFTPLMSVFLAFGQSFVIVCLIETVRRVSKTVHVIRGINEEIIKITVGKEIKEEEDKIDKDS